MGWRERESKRNEQVPHADQHPAAEQVGPTAEMLPPRGVLGREGLRWVNAVVIKGKLELLAARQPPVGWHGAQARKATSSKSQPAKKMAD